MTDGPTGIQVAPITEDDMSRVTDILKRAADAIVGMSQLSADVDMLRRTVAGLQADCERLRNQNNALDEALAHSRSVRDAQAAELAQVKAELMHAASDRDSLRDQLANALSKGVDLEADLQQAKKDRDDHGFRVMELEDELNKANAKLAQIREGYRTIFGSDSPPVPQAEAPKTELSQPTTLQDAHWPPEPKADEAHKPQAPTRTYHGSQWSPGALWDDEKREYYTES